MKTLKITILLFISSSFIANSQPVNNLCSNPTEVIVPTTGYTSLVSSNIGATSDQTSGLCANLEYEVWFSYIAQGPNNIVRVTPTGTSKLKNGKISAYSGQCASGDDYCGWSRNGGVTESHFGQSTFFPVKKGDRIWFEVACENASDRGDFLLEVISVDRILNDSCETAELITLPTNGVYTFNGSTHGAFTSGTLNDCKPAATREVWYKYVATGTNNTIRVSPRGNAPLSRSIIVAHRAPNACDLTHDGCDTADVYNGQVSVNLGSSEGDTIYFDISGAHTTGDFQVSITSITPPPSLGNTCADAIPICNKSPITISNINDISASGFEPTCFTNGASNQDVWLKFEVNKTGVLEWTADPNGIVELDWALYDITNGCPTNSDQSNLVTCNYHFSCVGNDDAIGMIDTLVVGAATYPIDSCPRNDITCQKEGEFCPPMIVDSGRTYVLIIEQFDANSVGFDLTWGGTFGMSGSGFCALPSDSIVWPGDANANLVVNNVDLLPIGIGYGSTGPARTNASINWVGQKAGDWSNTFINNMNYKHGDCNGDGVINATDTTAILVNYMQTHNKTSEINDNEAGNPTLFFDLVGIDTVLAGSTVTLPVHLGTIDSKVNDLYGIAFSVFYDPTLIDSSSMTMDFSNSWLGTGAEVLTLQKDIWNTGQIDVAITRIDQLNKTGNGLIGTLSFVMEENLAGKQLETIFDTLVLTPSLLTAISANEQEILIEPFAGQIIAKDESSGISSTPESQVEVYPNPARNSITIKHGSLPAQSITLRNVVGQVLLDQQTPNSGKTILDLSEFTPGTYIIGINGNEFQIVRRITITE